MTELAFWIQQIGIFVETDEEINVLNKTGLLEEECGKEVLWGHLHQVAMVECSPEDGKLSIVQAENKGNEHKLTIIWVI